MKVKVGCRQTGYNEDLPDVCGAISKDWQYFTWEGQKPHDITCCNRRCNGSYRLGDILAKFIQSGRQSEQGCLMCKGVMSAGTRYSQKCINFLHYDLCLDEDPDSKKPQGEAEQERHSDWTDCRLHSD